MIRTFFYFLIFVLPLNAFVCTNIAAQNTGDKRLKKFTAVYENGKKKNRIYNYINNRLATIEEYPGLIISFEYSEQGELTKITRAYTDNSSITTYDYDKEGEKNVIIEKKGNARTKIYVAENKIDSVKYEKKQIEVEVFSYKNGEISQIDTYVAGRRAGYAIFKYDSRRNSVLDNMGLPNWFLAYAGLDIDGAVSPNHNVKEIKMHSIDRNGKVRVGKTTYDYGYIGGYPSSAEVEFDGDDDVDIVYKYETVK